MRTIIRLNYFGAVCFFSVFGFFIYCLILWLKKRNTDTHTHTESESKFTKPQKPKADNVSLPNAAESHLKRERNKNNTHKTENISVSA